MEVLLLILLLKIQREDKFSFDFMEQPDWNNAPLVPEIGQIGADKGRRDIITSPE